MKESFLTQLADKVLAFIYQNGSGTECTLDYVEFKVDVFYFWVSGVFFYTRTEEKQTWDYPGDIDTVLDDFDDLRVFYQHQDTIMEDDLVLTAKELSFFESELLK